MRKSKQEAARTRERIVEAAALEFRRNGIAGTGLADLMAAAGLTHGGFYRHFGSKDQLVAEACAAAMEAGAKTSVTALSHHGKRNGLEALAANYLSKSHRDDRSGGCPFAALGSELVRADEKTRAVATEGLLKYADLIASQLDGMRPDDAKRRALAALSTMVGALILARIVTDPKLSALLLREAEKHVSAAQRRKRQLRVALRQDDRHTPQRGRGQ
jgi:TetR/AcrR family transcriptional regulator, transcriptional repressor for nem operon